MNRMRTEGNVQEYEYEGDVMARKKVRKTAFDEYMAKQMRCKKFANAYNKAKIELTRAPKKR